MAVCEHLIAADVAANCNNLIRTGVEQIGYIINKADIESISETDRVVDSIVLKTGKKAYRIQQLGAQPFNGTSSEMQEGDYAFAVRVFEEGKGHAALQCNVKNWSYTTAGQSRYLPCSVENGIAEGRAFGAQLWALAEKFDCIG